MTSTSAPSSKAPEAIVADTYRREWGRLLAQLVARTRRLDLAEDALSEAFAGAIEVWPMRGVPANPAGWVYTAAYRNILGTLRREATAGRAAPLLVVRPRPTEQLGRDDELPDDRLGVIALCCHPALAPPARSALALRLVIGTTTDEIARLFLVSTPTMAARLTRAKRKIIGVGIPLGEPDGETWRWRLDDICRAIYLAFTAGYTPGSGPDLLRAELAGDALRLALTLGHLVPDAAQVRALAALLLLQHSRRDARVRDGELVTLADQDRSRWHRDEIQRGRALLDSVPTGSGYVEELRLQATIAAKHAQAAAAVDTDWPGIAALYERLEVLTRSPVVRLNRAVAVAEAEGPLAGLRLLDEANGLPSRSHRPAAIRAELARRAGDLAAARQSYDTAIRLCANGVEREHLVLRLASL